MNLGKGTETLELKKTNGEKKESMVSISSILNKDKRDRVAATGPATALT